MEMKNKRLWYFIIFLFALVVNICFLIFHDHGPQRSRDYQVIYEPTAIKMVDYVKGNIDSVNLPAIIKQYPSLLFHFGYVVFVAIFYFMFGIGNVSSVVYFQVIISSIIPILLFHIALKNYHYKVNALIFTVISILFIDNMVFTSWATPESLYRFVFIISYYYLLKLYFVQNNFKGFLALFFLSFPLLAFIRIDTVILYGPVYVLLIFMIKRKTGYYAKVLITTAALAVITLALYWNYPYIVHTVKAIYVGGDVIIQFTKIEPFDYNLADNYLYIAKRGLKLYSLRVYEFLNIFPPFWSKTHKIYYGFHMIFFYLFSIFAIKKIWKSKDWYFSCYFMVFVSSLVLHMLTRVDAALRTNYTHLPFLILTAGYGFDYLVKIYQERKTRSSGVLNNKVDISGRL